MLTGMMYKFSNRRAQAALPILVLTILVISSIGAGVYLYFEKEKLSSFHMKKVGELNKKLTTLSETLKEREIENYQLKSKVDGLVKEAEDYKKRYQDISNLKLSLTEIKNSIVDEFTRIQTSIDAGFGKVENFSTGFDSRIENYLSSSKKELSDILKKHTPPEGKVEKRMKSSQVELPEIVVTPKVTQTPKEMKQVKVEDSPEAAPRVETPLGIQDPKIKKFQKKAGKTVKVMKVNQPHQFFVINKGMIDGIKVGSELRVFREDIKIGAAIITEVRELISLAEIKDQYGGHFIESGDIAKIL